MPSCNVHLASVIGGYRVRRTVCRYCLLRPVQHEVSGMGGGDAHEILVVGITAGPQPDGSREELTTLCPALD